MTQRQQFLQTLDMASLFGSALGYIKYAQFEFQCKGDTYHANMYTEIINELENKFKQINQTEVYEAK